MFSYAVSAKCQGRMGDDKENSQAVLISCREAFAGSWRHMYGLHDTWTALPPMPADGGAWSALHSWAMSTPSFVEFVLFAR